MSEQKMSGRQGGKHWASPSERPSADDHRNGGARTFRAASYAPGYQANRRALQTAEDRASKASRDVGETRKIAEPPCRLGHANPATTADLGSGLIIRKPIVEVVAVLSVQSQLVSDWRAKAESGRLQAAIFCHSASAAERLIL